MDLPSSASFRSDGAAGDEEPARKLWQRWRLGLRPEVSDFLAEGDQLDAGQVVAVLRVDQRERWLRGERVGAEEYLRHHPALAADANSGLDLVYGEFLLREQLGEAPSVDEYVRRFPQFGDEFRMQLELHRAIEAGAMPEPAQATQPGRWHRFRLLAASAGAALVLATASVLVAWRQAEAGLGEVCEQRDEARRQLEQVTKDFKAARLNLAQTLDTLGGLLDEAGRSDEAEAAYRRAVAILEKLVRQNPGDGECATALAGQRAKVDQRARSARR